MVLDIQVAMTYNDLAVDIQVVYCPDHRVVELVIADRVGHRRD